MRRRSAHSFHRSKGFTLIELLMAIVIAAIAMAIVNASFFQAHRSIELVSDQRQAYQMVRIVMDRMTKDMSCAFVPATEGTSRTLDDEEISLYRFIGTDESDAETDLDGIHFTTTTDLGLPGRMGGLCEVGYYLEEMENSKGRYVLIRSEDPLPHYGVSESGREMEVAENISSMNIVYIDQEDQEQEDWDLAEKLALPKQVRVTVVFDVGAEPLEFTGVAFLPLSGLKLAVSQGEEP